MPMAGLLEELWKESIPGGGRRLARVRNPREEPGPLQRTRALVPGEVVYAGVPGQFRRVGRDLAAEHLAEAAGRGRELGEPTSFAAGAGAPEPIPIMRGTTTTYTTQPPGARFALPEVATPLQAQQAFNRAMLQRNLAAVATTPALPGETPEALPLRRERLAGEARARFGEYRAPEQTIAEIVARGKEPPGVAELHKAQATALQRQIRTATEDEAAQAFHRLWGPQYGVFEPKTRTYAIPTDMPTARAYKRAEDIARTKGPEEALADYRQSLLVNQYEPLFTPRSLEALGIILPPGAREDTERWQAFVLRFGPRLQAQREAEAAGRRWTFPALGEGMY